MRSKLIWLLALYIDFIVIGTFLALANYFVGLAYGYATGAGVSWYLEIAVSAGFTALARALGLSLGMALLDYALDEAQAENPGRLWANLVLGTVLILDGLKMMIRWSQLDIAMPVFGMVETTPLKVVLLLVMGAVSLVAGCMLLAFAHRAKLAVAGAIVLSTISLVVSWPVMNEAIGRVQVARRQMQGLPLREGEINAMQSMLPILSASVLAAALVLLWLSRERRT